MAVTGKQILAGASDWDCGEVELNAGVNGGSGLIVGEDPERGSIAILVDPDALSNVCIYSKERPRYGVTGVILKPGMAVTINTRGKVYGTIDPTAVTSTVVKWFSETGAECPPKNGNK